MKHSKQLIVAFISFLALTGSVFACTNIGDCVTDCPAPPSTTLAARPWCLNGAEKGQVVTTSNVSATWTVSGATSFSGSGTSQTATVPIGTYTITWGTVPGYVTPASQTLTVSNDGDIITFSGTYTAPVVNVNFSIFKILKNFFSGLYL